MKKHVKTYMQHFNIGIDDLFYDELEWAVNDRFVRAVNVHHIKHGANKEEHINNYMALSYSNHQKAHAEILKRKYLKQIHLDFLQTNPY